MRIKRDKIIYYRPGIISLMILPCIFIYYANKELNEKSLTILPVFFANVDLINEHPQFFVHFNGHFPPLRKYVDIELDDNNEYNNIKLDFAKLKVREILSRNDFVNGVHFKFNHTCNFGEFVKVINILKIEDAKTFMPLEDEIWFYNFTPEKPVKSIKLIYL